MNDKMMKKKRLIGTFTLVVLAPVMATLMPAVGYTILLVGNFVTHNDLAVLLAVILAAGQMFYMRVPSSHDCKTCRVVCQTRQSLEQHVREVHARN
jgi:hypothetical protein